ncbi:MAG: hypothetical protein N3E37_01455 [Candidatus Micrarchaeota archaeon]|nr:hypothetical protein [Candidatus Micrarchaeota archaeon]
MGLLGLSEITIKVISQKLLFDKFTLIKLIFFVFALANIYFSQCMNNSIIINLVNFQQSWLVIVLGLLIIFTTAVLYIVAQATHNVHLLVRVKEEITYILLVIALIIVVDLIYIPVCSMIKDPNIDYHAVAINFVKKIDNYQRNLIKELNYQAVDNWANSAKYSYRGWFIWEGEGRLDLPSSDNKATYILRDAYINFLVTAQVSITIQRIILDLLSVNFLLMIFIIGLIFKLIPGLRDFGNAFFAIGISVYFFVPFIYANYAFHESKINDLISNEFLECFSVSNKFIRYEKYSLYFPEAFFLPNLIIVLSIISINSLIKGMRMIDSFIENMLW